MSGWRSVLCVPADDERKLAKARSLGADRILFDLEDGCAEENRWSAFGELPARLVAGDSVRLPREVAWLERAAELPDYVALWIPKYEEGLFIPRGAMARARMFVPLIETPAGVAACGRIVRQLAGRCVALAFGSMDFSARMGVSLQSRAVELARFQVALAARTAGIPAIDAPCFDLGAGRNAAECLAAKELGFEGKGCIHPSQIEECNRTFTPVARVARGERRPVFRIGNAVVGPSLCGGAE
jgi:citrate lyase beta subunit